MRTCTERLATLVRGSRTAWHAALVEDYMPEKGRVIDRRVCTRDARDNEPDRFAASAPPAAFNSA
jgi:hypothetical protein